MLASRSRSWRAQRALGRGKGPKGVRGKRGKPEFWGVSPVSPCSACRFPRPAAAVPHVRAARQRGALCTFRGHPALVLLAPSPVIGTDSTSNHAARQRGALGSFHRHPALVLLAPSPVSWYGQHPHLFFLQRFRIRLPSWALRSGAVVILTSAARSGGEVRITEAERPRHVIPGRRGVEPESRRIVAVWANAALCCRCASCIQVSTRIPHTWRALRG